jgi:hypothetical protein
VKISEPTLKPSCRLAERDEIRRQGVRERFDGVPEALVGNAQLMQRA